VIAVTAAPRRRPYVATINVGQTAGDMDMTSRTLTNSHPGTFDALLSRQADLIGQIAEAIYELSVRRILRAIKRSA
jgi:hypothetical protein